MRKLREILECLESRFEVQGESNVLVNHIYSDSRKISENDVFVAIKGHSLDGHNYIDSAINNKASVIFCEDFPSDIQSNVCYVKVAKLRSQMPLLAEAFYGSKKEMTLIGVTGTNGKTTVATLFFNTIKAMGISCGLLSTVMIKINDNQYPSELTTPDVFTLFRFMKMMRSQGCKHCIMEVSSHAIDQGRIDGLAFDVAAFTNLSHDHLDYHSSFKEYAYTKKKLFDGLSPKSDAIFNADDRNGSVMVQNTRAKKISYGMVMNADYKARILENDFSGMHVRIEEHDFFTRLVGKFNVYNILAVLAIAESVGYERLDVLKALSNVTTAAGRFEIIRSSTENITAIVDYAHTPDALENVLTTISQVNKNKGKIITLIGCGGDRDKTKRPLMAKVAVDLSDSVILTSDNPRSENPDDILDDMEKGIEKTESRKVLRISDRKSAIKTAISIANPKDVILVAGKGHETYQEINGIKHPFDDKQILQEFLLQ